MKECCFHISPKPLSKVYASFFLSFIIHGRPPPSTPISYTLPDNQEVHLDKDSYFLPEIMMIGNNTVGFVWMD